MTRSHLPFAFPKVFDVTARREISEEPRPEGGGLRVRHRRCIPDQQGAAHAPCLTRSAARRPSRARSGRRRWASHRLLIDRGCSVVVTRGVQRVSPSSVAGSPQSTRGKPRSRKAWRSSAGSMSSSATESCTTLKARYARHAIWRPSERAVRLPQGRRRQARRQRPRRRRQPRRRSGRRRPRVELRADGRVSRSSPARSTRPACCRDRASSARTARSLKARWNFNTARGLVIDREVYLGTAFNCEHRFPGAHEPIVDVDLYKAAKPRSRHKSHRSRPTATCSAASFAARRAAT